MPQKYPHISLDQTKVLPRVLNIPPEEFSSWPEAVQELTATLAYELFIIRYNPFIIPERVAKSVFDRLKAEKAGLTAEDHETIKSGLMTYWQDFQQDQQFKSLVKERLSRIVPLEHIVSSPNALVECSTDATDLRLEVPMFLVAPGSSEEVQKIVLLANELGFKIVPRGGGSGLTGGAIPARRRSIILSLSRMKSILDIDPDRRLLCAQSGVITLNAIQAVAEQDLLFTVDPASKASSSLGGNISENAGGPFAFEYGTTVDNIFSYTMVLPTGDLIHVRRKSHPWHKILPDETAVYEILDEHLQLKETLEVPGSTLRAPKLGKDVSDKYLGGLPGIQKEGVDGIITKACFTLHPRPIHSNTLCLEFFGSSMHNAMLVIRDLVKLRDRIRDNGDLVKMSALEEFGTKYVQAIDYQKKSVSYEGEPISVLLIQLDSNDAPVLREITEDIVNIAQEYSDVDVFVASDEKQAEVFWRDRHRLSAITRRTSGFKINEDVVIPLEVIPEFSDFIEGLNLYYLGLAYRTGLQQVMNLEGIDPGDEFIDMELTFAGQVIKAQMTTRNLGEQEFELQIYYFFRDLLSRYPDLAPDLEEIEEKLFNTRIMVANHMHAGDGNCHVNIPVNSGDPQMLRLAEEAASKVFDRVLQLNGSVSGEHGIGITKIGFLSQDKIEALKAYKAQIDPQNLLNPGKLVKQSLDVVPFTFSFNRLIQDIRKTSLKQKEKLIDLLKNIQTCSRCGKCKQVCPMYYPEQGFLYHPRNKIITLGALIEALYYSLLDRGEPDPWVLDRLNDIIEHCTACGKCTAVCPVGIGMSGQILAMRSLLEDRDQGVGEFHPVKNRVLRYLNQDPAQRLPRTAKLAALGQGVQNKVVGHLPKFWRAGRESLVLRHPGPSLTFTNLYQKIGRGESLFVPQNSPANPSEGVLYFPGCGGSLFFSSIGLASLYLLLKMDVPAALPKSHLCCGYPLLSAGCSDQYQINLQRTSKALSSLIDECRHENVDVSSILTSCGTCREALLDCDLPQAKQRIQYRDVCQEIIERIRERPDLIKDMRQPAHEGLLFHAACHSAWHGLPPDKSADIIAEALEHLLDTPTRVSPGCCGESGLGALTSPRIYNTIRHKKAGQLKRESALTGSGQLILVSCPSCKMGLMRIIEDEKLDLTVLHVLEYLAGLIGGPQWQKELQDMLMDFRTGQQAQVVP